MLPLCLAHVAVQIKNKTKIILVVRVSIYGLWYVVLEIIYFFLNFFLIVF